MGDQTTHKIDAACFCAELALRNFDFFTGVPDSLLSDFTACLADSSQPYQNIITANEGSAIGLAAGYYLSTGTCGVVYMQNSGLGNAVNPLQSLADEEVYSIPMLLIIGWRGEPGTKDEPQHVKQGKTTIPLLEAMGIPFQVLDADNYIQQLDWCADIVKAHSAPVALVVQKGTFDAYPFTVEDTELPMTREGALEAVLENISPDDLVVATTGKTAREIFELRVARGEGHANDFLTVGAMGHTASIALGMSLGTNKDVYCIDGDGSLLMHMGSLATVTDQAGANFKYILNDNGAHESVGGQPTVSRQLNIRKILQGLGFEEVFEVENTEEIVDALRQMKGLSKAALILQTRQGSRKDLGRPTLSPQQNKIALMENIRSESIGS